MNDLSIKIASGFWLKKEYSGCPDPLLDRLNSLLTQITSTLISECNNPDEIKTLLAEIENDPEQHETKIQFSNVIDAQQNNLSKDLFDMVENLENLTFQIIASVDWAVDDQDIPIVVLNGNGRKAYMATPSREDEREPQNDAENTEEIYVDEVFIDDEGEYEKCAARLNLEIGTDHIEWGDAAAELTEDTDLDMGATILQIDDEDLIMDGFDGGDLSTATIHPVASWREILEEEFRNMQPGIIAFNPPEVMKVGRPERVEARITKDQNTDLLSTLKGRGHPHIEGINVYEFMRVDLSGDDFIIEKLNESDQVITPLGFTEWSWTVTPQKKGVKVLHLHVSIRIKLPDSEKTKGHPVIDKQIVVIVNPAYSVKHFVKEHWKWLITALVIPLAGLIWKNLS